MMLRHKEDSNKSVLKIIKIRTKIVMENTRNNIKMLVILYKINQR